MPKKEKRMVLILILIAIVAIVLFINFRKGDTDQKVGEQTKQNILGIDVNDEAYAGKKIYEQNGDIIIENPNGSKTIEKLKEAETDLKELSSEEKAKYEITEVKVNITGNRTEIKGKVKNNTKGTKKISVGVTFYTNDNRVKGSANAIIEKIKARETKEFEMIIMGNMSGYTHKVEVEYTN